MLSPGLPSQCGQQIHSPLVRRPILRTHLPSRTDRPIGSDWNALPVMRGIRLRPPHARSRPNPDLLTGPHPSHQDMGSPSAQVSRSLGFVACRECGLRLGVLPGRFFASLEKRKRPASTQPFIPGSQGRSATRVHRPSASCTHPQPPIAHLLPEKSDNNANPLGWHALS